MQISKNMIKAMMYVASEMYGEPTIEELSSMLGWDLVKTHRVVTVCMALGVITMRGNKYRMTHKTQEGLGDIYDVMTTGTYTEKDLCELTGWGRTKVRDRLYKGLMNGTIRLVTEGGKGRGNAAEYENVLNGAFNH